MEEVKRVSESKEKLSLFHLTWPIFFEVFLFTLMGVADTFMLSDLDDDAVAGVGAANQFIYITILILEVIGNGASIVVAQYLGSRRFEEVPKIAAVAITMNLAIGLVLYIKKILEIGVPSAFEQILYQACQITFLYYVTYLGPAALAARQYAYNISMFTYLFAIAIGSGTAIIVGRYVGANRKNDAYFQLWTSVKWAISFTLVMVTFVMFFRYPLMKVFTHNSEVIKMGASVLLLSILLETGRTFNITIINSLRAAGDARYPVTIGFFSMVCMSLPLGYFLVYHLHLGLVGIWLAIAADEWCRAILVFFRWKSRRWERYALVAPNKN